MFCVVCLMWAAHVARLELDQEFQRSKFNVAVLIQYSFIRLVAFNATHITCIHSVERFQTANIF